MEERGTDSGAQSILALTTTSSPDYRRWGIKIAGDVIGLH